MPSVLFRSLRRLFVGAAIVPATLQAQAPNEVDRLAWLSGCWELRGATRVTHEQWMSPLGGMMLGMSRTVVRDVAREYEALRIQSVEGVVTYVAQPGGQPPTAFPATTVSDTLVVFANPSHDFPQRIIYRRPAGSDSLHARIEGDRGGKAQGIDFRMKRDTCAGDAGRSGR